MSRKRARWIFKDSDKLVSHCKCKVGVSGSLPQLDCPWCGCGWMFACAKCRRAFTFGRIAEIDAGELKEIAIEQIHCYGQSDPSTDDVQLKLEEFEALVGDHQVGERVVVMDGVLIPAAHEGELAIEGLFARHDLPWLPHTRALKDSSALDKVLASGDNWNAHRIAEE